MPTSRKPTVALFGLLLATSPLLHVEAHAGDMSRFVGRYPWEKIDGQSFFEAIQPDFVATFGKARWKVFASYKTSPPMRHQSNPVLGDLLDVSICLPHSCGVADARILLEERTGRILELCFESYNQTTMRRTSETVFSHQVEWMGVTLANGKWFFRFQSPPEQADDRERDKEAKSRPVGISCGPGWEEFVQGLVASQ